MTHDNEHWMSKIEAEGKSAKPAAQSHEKPASEGGFMATVRKADIAITRAWRGEKAAEHQVEAWDAYDKGDLKTSAAKSAMAYTGGDGKWMHKMGLLSDSPGTPDKPKSR